MKLADITKIAVFCFIRRHAQLCLPLFQNLTPIVGTSHFTAAGHLRPCQMSK